MPTSHKYLITLPHILAIVAIEGMLVGKIYELRFIDHDLHDENKFPDFKPQYYMRVVPTEDDKPPELQFQ